MKQKYKMHNLLLKSILAYFSLFPGTIMSQICEGKLLSYEYHKSDGWIRDESLNVSSDGSKLVYAALNHVFILDRQYGDKKHFYEESQVSCTALDPFGKFLAVATDTKLSMYNTSDLSKIFSISITNKIYNMNFFGNNIIGTSSGKILYFSNEGVLLAEKAVGESMITRCLIRKVNESTALILLSKEGNDELVKYDVTKMKIISNYLLEYEAHDIDVSPNSKYIGINAKKGKDYFLEILLYESYLKYYTYNSPSLYRINTLSFSPNSKYIAIGNNSNSDHVHIVDVVRKMPLGTLNLGIISKIYYSIDGIDAVQFDRKNNSLFASVVETMVNYQVQCIIE